MSPPELHSAPLITGKVHNTLSNLKFYMLNVIDTALTENDNFDWQSKA